MKGLKIKDMPVIGGFKVMEGVRSIREGSYNFYKKDPKAYYRQVREAGEWMKELFDGA
jgi:hypothetical protein